MTTRLLVALAHNAWKGNIMNGRQALHTVRAMQNEEYLLYRLFMDTRGLMGDDKRLEWNMLKGVMKKFDISVIR